MAEEYISESKPLKFAGRTLSLNEFVRRALSKAVEWMDYQGLKGDERTDFMNAFYDKLDNIVSGKDTVSDAGVITGGDGQGERYYSKRRGIRKNGKRGPLGRRREGFDPDGNVDVYLNGIAGAMPEFDPNAKAKAEIEKANTEARVRETESKAKAAAEKAKLPVWSSASAGEYLQNKIFGAAGYNVPQLELWANQIDPYDSTAGNRGTSGRQAYVETAINEYLNALKSGKYNISDLDKENEINLWSGFLLDGLNPYEIGRIASWAPGLLFTGEKYLTPEQLAQVQQQLQQLQELEKKDAESKEIAKKADDYVKGVAGATNPYEQGTQEYDAIENQKKEYEAKKVADESNKFNDDFATKTWSYKPSDYKFTTAVNNSVQGTSFAKFKTSSVNRYLNDVFKSKLDTDINGLDTKSTLDWENGADGALQGAGTGVIGGGVVGGAIPAIITAAGTGAAAGTASTSWSGPGMLIGAGVGALVGVAGGIGSTYLGSGEWGHDDLTGWGNGDTKLDDYELLDYWSDPALKENDQLPDDTIMAWNTGAKGYNARSNKSLLGKAAVDYARYEVGRTGDDRYTYKDDEYILPQFIDWDSGRAYLFKFQGNNATVSEINIGSVLNGLDKNSPLYKTLLNAWREKNGKPALKKGGILYALSGGEVLQSTDGSEQLLITPEQKEAYIKEQLYLQYLQLVQLLQAAQQLLLVAQQLPQLNNQRYYSKEELAILNRHFIPTLLFLETLDLPLFVPHKLTISGNHAYEESKTASLVNQEFYDETQLLGPEAAAKRDRENSTKFTATDYARLGTAVADITGAICSFTAVGSTAGAVIGAASTLTQFGLDIADKNVSIGEAATGLIGGLALDALTLIPTAGAAAPLAKAAKTIAKLAGPILMGLQLMGNAEGAIATLKKVKDGDIKNITVGEWRQFCKALNAITNASTMAKTAYDRKIGKFANLVDDGERKFTFKKPGGNEGETISLTLNQIKSINEAGNTGGNTAALNKLNSYLGEGNSVESLEGLGDFSHTGNSKYLTSLDRALNTSLKAEGEGVPGKMTQKMIDLTLKNEQDRLNMGTFRRTIANLWGTDFENATGGRGALLARLAEIEQSRQVPPMNSELQYLNTPIDENARLQHLEKTSNAQSLERDKFEQILRTKREARNIYKDEVLSNAENIAQKQQELDEVLSANAAAKEQVFKDRDERILRTLDRVNDYRRRLQAKLEEITKLQEKQEIVEPAEKPKLILEQEDLLSRRKELLKRESTSKLSKKEAKELKHIEYLLKSNKFTGKEYLQLQEQYLEEVQRLTDQRKMQLQIMHDRAVTNSEKGERLISDLNEHKSQLSKREEDIYKAISDEPIIAAKDRLSEAEEYAKMRMETEGVKKQQAYEEWKGYSKLQYENLTGGDRTKFTTPEDKKWLELAEATVDSKFKGQSEEATKLRREHFLKFLEDLKYEGYSQGTVKTLLSDKDYVNAAREVYKFKIGGLINPLKGTYTDFFAKGGLVLKAHNGEKIIKSDGNGGYTDENGNPVDKDGNPLLKTSTELSELKVDETTANGTTPETTSAELPYSLTTPAPATKKSGDENDKTVLLKNRGDKIKSMWNNFRRVNPITPLELLKYGAANQANALMRDLKKLLENNKWHPYRTELKIWSNKDLLDKANEVKTDYNRIGELAAEGTTDQGSAFVYRKNAYNQGEEAARPYVLKWNDNLVDSVEKSIANGNSNTKNAYDVYKLNHESDIAKKNNDLYADIQYASDRGTKRQQLLTSMQNGIGKGLLQKWADERNNNIVNSPILKALKNEYDAIEKEYNEKATNWATIAEKGNDANATEADKADAKKAIEEMQNLKQRWNDVISRLNIARTEVQNRWDEEHPQPSAVPFYNLGYGGNYYSSNNYRTPFNFGSANESYLGNTLGFAFKKGGSITQTQAQENGRARRHAISEANKLDRFYSKLYHDTQKTLLTENNKKLKMMSDGFAYFLKLMMQPK